MRRLLLSLMLVGLCLSPVAHAAPLARPNIVVILTDDMRWDELENMPNVRSLIQDKGVTFPNAFVSNSSCCPSRATILTGRYSDKTGVWNNVQGTGGWWAFQDDESNALPVWLQGGGYRTALVGKYLNGYSGRDVPPGWDRWVAFSGKVDYYGYTLNVDGTLQKHRGKRPTNYSTDVLGAQAVSFVSSAPASQPFFLYFTPFGPHRPFTPAPRDANTALTVSALPANVNEDVSDKPAYIRAFPSDPAKHWMDVKLAQERALLSVDQWVGEIVDAVAARGQLHSTVFLFMSDNGLQLGSHRWDYKQVPYEESIHVPMLWRYDDADWTGVDGRLVTNADVAPTIAALARIKPSRKPQGFSLRSHRHRSAFPLEHVVQSASDDGSSAPTFCGVRTLSAMFTRYSTGEEELYDLVADPLELTNVASDPAYATLLAASRARAIALCSPSPPGFAWS